MEKLFYIFYSCIIINNTNIICSPIDSRAPRKYLFKFNFVRWQEKGSLVNFHAFSSSHVRVCNAIIWQFIHPSPFEHVVGILWHIAYLIFIFILSYEPPVVFIHAQKRETK